MSQCSSALGLSEPADKESQFIGQDAHRKGTIAPRDSIYGAPCRNWLKINPKKDLEMKNNDINWSLRIMDAGTFLNDQHQYDRWALMQGISKLQRKRYLFCCCGRAFHSTFKGFWRPDDFHCWKYGSGRITRRSHEHYVQGLLFGGFWGFKSSSCTRINCFDRVGAMSWQWIPTIWLWVTTNENIQSEKPSRYSDEIFKLDYQLWWKLWS